MDLAVRSHSHPWIPAPAKRAFAGMTSGWMWSDARLEGFAVVRLELVGAGLAPAHVGRVAHGSQCTKPPGVAGLVHAEAL